ncbi:Ribokinase-like protein [Multifurca ochricompacta]|uniref:Ribokinase n=1 Tax=Multifurca ochricompacta TaxID=376703 RepID=A0AAD4M880_9AGAM|nr:Ribokinase-like protein [Multifurca ochricompacta]
MSHRPPRCLVRGSLNIDEFFYVQDVVRPGQTISSSKFERRGGGKGANQATAVARAGGAVSLVGAVGEDGAWLVRDLEGYGVSVANVSIVQEVTGRAIIQLTAEGENCIILHKGANYALPDPPAQSNVEQHLAGISHLLLQNEVSWSSILAYLEYAHIQGIVTIFNPSPMPGDKQLRDFPWASLSWLIVNEGEAESLLRVIDRNPGCHEVEAEYPSEWPDDNKLKIAFSTLNQLSRCDVLTSTDIVCTLGATGVVASVRGLGEMLYFPAATLQGVVRDTTGAGDCFTGYFVTGLMEFGNKQLSKDEIAEILQLSVQAAGMCVEMNGAMESIPGREAVEARLL